MNRSAVTSSPPLADRLVVDLSTGIAGAYCTKLLADGGADVVLAEPPDGHPLRRWSATGAELDPGEDGALFAHLSSTKRSLLVDPGGDLAYAAEVGDHVVLVYGSAPDDALRALVESLTTAPLAR